MKGFSKFHFKDIGANEQIIQIVHRNWFYLLQQFFLVLVIFMFFMGGFIFVPVFFPDFLEGVDSSLVLFAKSFFMLSVWIYCFLVWIDYYFDVWIITSDRIINVEQKGLFTRRVSELRYQKIQDVTTEVVGFLPTIINYGDVRVQTAAEEREFIFRTVSDPYGIKNTIMSLQKQNEKKITTEIDDMIEKIKS